MSRARLADVKFCIPSWGDAEADAHASELIAMEAYVQAACSAGLGDEEMSEDVASRWGYLGPAVRVKTVGRTVWVVVDDGSIV